jgi:hypothetical protein
MDPGPRPSKKELDKVSQLKVFLYLSLSDIRLKVA